MVACVSLSMVWPKVAERSAGARVKNASGSSGARKGGIKKVGGGSQSQLDKGQCFFDKGSTHGRPGLPRRNGRPLRIDVGHREGARTAVILVEAIGLAVALLLVGYLVLALLFPERF